MTDLQLANVCLSYDRPVRRGAIQRTDVLDRLSLTIGAGEFVAVLGRSGSGKTTLLNLAAGFLSPTKGRVSVDGEPVLGPSADRAVVFQDDALFAWLSARDNVALPLNLKGIPAGKRRARADELLNLVGLLDHADKSIWELSGGQRQRVGIARALAADPKFLLMDEPLGALDAMTRERMQELLLKVWGASRTGVLLITHSVEEALFLATRVVVLVPDPGRIVIDRSVDFSRRFLAGEKGRALRAEPGFIALREELISAIGLDEERQLA
jgi:taurine transport system ATP-binding protein